MAHTNYFKDLKSHWRLIFIIALSTVILSLLLSLLFPLQYSSTVRLLIIQKSGLNLDPYTALKSAERVGDNLSQVIYTSAFFNQVLNSRFSIDKNYFKDDEIKRRKQWRKMIYSQVLRGTGMLEVVVYHEDKSQATQIANAIAYVLTTEGNNYTGGSSEIKLVDSALESRYPVKPNFIANGITGLVVGLVLGSAYVLFIVSRKKDHNWI